MQSRIWYRIPVLAAFIVAVLAFALPQATAIVNAAASLQLPRATVPQAAIVVVNGSGFTSPDNATVYIDAPVSGHSQHIQATAVVGANGSFSAHLSVPRFVSPGTYPLTGKDAHGISAVTHLTILPLLVVRTGAPTASATVIAHMPFYIDALGFAANETVKIQATFPTYDGNNVVVTRTPNANASGNVFDVAMTPPNGAKIGFAAVSAAGQTSKKQAPGRVYVTYQAYIVAAKSTVTVGTAAGIIGRGFDSNSDVRVQITINSSNGQQTLSVTAVTDGNGNFTKYITVPSYANSGTYTVVATDVASGLKRYAKVNVVARPSRPTPNQDVSFAGTGFPANTTVTVSATIDLRGGGNRTISKSLFSDSNGHFSTSLRVPYKAAQGTYTVTASASGAHASDQLTVLPFSVHPSNLNFRRTSLWYHVVRHGTYDVISIQATLPTTLGIWAHVIFPNGLRHDYYTNTNGSGGWSTKFTIPRNAVSRHSNQGYITLQLWHGHQTTQSFIDFTIV